MVSNNICKPINLDSKTGAGRKKEVGQNIPGEPEAFSRQEIKIVLNKQNPTVVGYITGSQLKELPMAKAETI